MPYNHDIIDSVCHHCDTKELLALNQVSSQVHALAVSRLYRSIAIASRKQLVLLQHALVDQPRRRSLIRSVTLLERVVSLYVRAANRPSGYAGRGYIYGDVDITQCLALLLIPLPNLSHLEIQTNLANLIHAEPNMIRALNEVLVRSYANTVIVGGKPVSIPEESFIDTEHGRVFRLFAHGDPSRQILGTITYPVMAIAPSGTHERNLFIRCHYGTDPDLDQRCNEYFPLPFDNMELHPPYDPPFPVLHWLGFGSYFSRSVVIVYQMTSNIKHSSPLQYMAFLTSAITLAVKYIFSKLFRSCLMQ
jgi:hypothetical protein